MNILITRPLIDAENLMEKFFSTGHKILHIPTLKISPKYMIPISSDDFDAFIFTSANAARNLKLSNQNRKTFCYCVGSITEKIVRQLGFQNTFSAGGTVNALKNLIINSNKLDEKSKISYFCGDNISYNLDVELKKEGYDIKKIINYSSEKITELSDENKKIIENNVPDLIFIYSLRSAQSFVEISKNYSLYPLMTGSTVMCISKKVADFFKVSGWKKIEVFNPGEELLRLQ